MVIELPIVPASTTERNAMTEPKVRVPKSVPPYTLETMTSLDETQCALVRSLAMAAILRWSTGEGSDDILGLDDQDRELLAQYEDVVEHLSESLVDIVARGASGLLGTIFVHESMVQKAMALVGSDDPEKGQEIVEQLIEAYEQRGEGAQVVVDTRSGRVLSDEEGQQVLKTVDFANVKAEDDDDLPGSGMYL